MASFENALLAWSLVGADGSVRAPSCCGQPMQGDGGCAEGCCDDYACRLCGRTRRVEWPD